MLNLPTHKKQINDRKMCLEPATPAQYLYTGVRREWPDCVRSASVSNLPYRKVTYGYGLIRCVEIGSLTAINKNLRGYFLHSLGIVELAEAVSQKRMYPSLLAVTKPM